MDSSQAKPTAEQVKEWDADVLLDWIKKNRPKLLKVDQLKKFEAEGISGDVFLNHAGDVGFKNQCGLTTEASYRLANLAREFAEAGEVTAGIKSKLLSFMSCTLRRQQANNITGSRQQAEDVEMSDAADMKSKLLSFISCTSRRQQANNLTGPRREKDAFKAGIPYKPPRPLLNSSGVDWVFQPHPNLYKTLAPHVLEHYTQYRKDRVDKTYAPIYFYLGGAGTGKSRHGSEFASSVQEAIKLCIKDPLYHELAQRLKTAFVFHVSFENETTLTPEEKRKPWKAIGVRMLHQLLGEPISVIRHKYDAEPGAIFRLVAAAEKVDLYDDFTGILVVDGIQNAFTRIDDSSGLYSLLDQIADLSLMSRSSETEGKRTRPFIMTCVTATHFGPANGLTVGGHRKRVYLPLNLIDAPTWKSDNSQVLDNDPGTRLLLKDVGGHARAIEVIADELAERLQPNITELADVILYKLMDRYKDAVSVMRGHILPVVQCILSRQLIRLPDLIPGSDWRWEHFTAPGLLWFERAETGFEYYYNYHMMGYLVAPYIWLRMLARLTSSENTDLLRQFVGKWEFNGYKELLRLRTGERASRNIIWQNFETFCCYFRILRSLGFEDGEEVRFNRLHAGCKKLRDDGNTVVVNRHLGYAEAVHQHSTKATSPEDVVTKRSGTLNADDQLFYVILNTSAGDFFLSIDTYVRPRPWKHRRGKIGREVGQCKFLREKLTQDTYDKERNKSVGPDDFFILYTTTEISGDFALSDRSGLVDKTCWNSYFGPFASRAFIASQYVGSQVKEL